MSFNGGYVDTLGFLALQGLFTAHVTGNFVTIGAALVFGRVGVFAKLLALPVFCVVVIASRRASLRLVACHMTPLPILLSAQLLLLMLGGACAVLHGAFAQPDSSAAWQRACSSSRRWLFKTLCTDYIWRARPRRH
jgi:uncharacterized membrane protein YoaK (UPF0700 family)